MSQILPRFLRRVVRLATLAALALPCAATAATPDARPIAFDVDGYADVRTGIQGRVVIAGSFAGTYDDATQRFTGAFTLTPTKARVTVLGLLPVVAETDWIFTEAVTGEWKDGVLRLHAAVRIRHPRLLAFGGAVIAGGGRCATKEPSILDFSTDPATPVVDPFDGGTLTTGASGFSISALAGCGLLDPLLSAVAAGGGNQSTLRLTPRPAR